MFRSSPQISMDNGQSLLGGRIVSCCSDTETRTSIDQTFIFGIYRIGELVEDSTAALKKASSTTSFRSENSMSFETSLANSFPDIEVPSFPPKILLSVHGSLLEFMEHVFFPALRNGWLIAGFNLPFDLSRLSLDWRKTRKGGFALIFSKIFWRETQSWIANPYRPTIKIEAKDARTAFISCGTTKVPAEWPNEGQTFGYRYIVVLAFRSTPESARLVPLLPRREKS